MIAVMGIAATIIPLFAILVFRRIGDRGDLLYESSSLMGGPASGKDAEPARLRAVPGPARAEAKPAPRRAA